MGKRSAQVSQIPVPYNGSMVVALLRRMPAERLAAIHHHDFQRWPAEQVLPAATLREMIANERAHRRG